MSALTSPAYISVLNFGAVGNGSTDDTAALQAAFDYAEANNLEVYIPPGNYLHTGILQANGIVVFGAGDSTQLTSTVAGSEALYLTGTNPALYDIQMAGVAASQLSNNASAQVVVQYASGFTVENVHVVRSSSVGIFTIDSSNGNILHNTVQGTLADGIYTTVASSKINIANNLTIDTGDDAISVSSYVGDPGYTHNILISDNTVTGNWQSRSITVNGGYGIVIEHNYIDGGTAGVSVGSEGVWGTRNVYNVSVTQNTILNTTYTGEGTIGGGGLSLYSDVGASGLTITGNSVYLPAHDGIFVTGTSQIQAKINSNDIFASSTHPTYVNKDAKATEINESNNPELAPTAYVATAPISGNGVNPAIQLPIADPAGSVPTTPAPTPTSTLEPTLGLTTQSGGWVQDAAGNIWTLTSSGSVKENGTAVPGGSGTAELTLVNNVVYAEDAGGTGWYTYSTATQSFTPAAAPTISITQTGEVVSLSNVSISANTGNNIVFITGSNDTVSLSGGTDTITDSGTSNTYIIPAAGTGYDAFTNNILTAGDTLDLRTALAATRWTGRTASLSQYLSGADTSTGAVLSISPTRGGEAVGIASIAGASTSGLTTLLAHSIT